MTLQNDVSMLCGFMQIAEWDFRIHMHLGMHHSRLKTLIGIQAGFCLGIVVYPRNAIAHVRRIEFSLVRAFTSCGNRPSFFIHYVHGARSEPSLSL